jgi:hypothetical protein
VTAEVTRDDVPGFVNVKRLKAPEVTQRGSLCSLEHDKIMQAAGSSFKHPELTMRQFTASGRIFSQSG